MKLLLATLLLTQVLHVEPSYIRLDPPEDPTLDWSLLVISAGVISKVPRADLATFVAAHPEWQVASAR